MECTAGGYNLKTRSQQCSVTRVDTLTDSPELAGAQSFGGHHLCCYCVVELVRVVSRSSALTLQLLSCFTVGLSIFCSSWVIEVELALYPP